MRYFFDIVVVLSVLFAPFWFMVGLCVLGIYIFSGWYEIIFAFALYELLFGVSLPEFMHAPDTSIPIVLYAVALVITAEWLRKRIRERTI